jgi:hypothetical protein
MNILVPSPMVCAFVIGSTYAGQGRKIIEKDSIDETIFITANPSDRIMLELMAGSQVFW